MLTATLQLGDPIKSFVKISSEAVDPIRKASGRVYTCHSGRYRNNYGYNAYQQRYPCK